MNLPPRGVSQLRGGRISLPGRIYFVTKSAINRLAEGEPFTDGVLMGEGIPQLVIATLRWLHRKEHIDLLAYVVMPDHVHVLFRLRERQELADVMRRFGSYTGRQIAAKLGH